MSNRKPKTIEATITPASEEVMFRVQGGLELIAGLEFDWNLGEPKVTLFYDAEIHTEEEAFDYLAEALVRNGVEVVMY